VYLSNQYRLRLLGFGFRYFWLFESVLSPEIVSYVRRFDCSPSLVVTHDCRDKVYGFVKACTEFRSMLTSDCLRFAYSVASRDFVDCMAPLFIVLTDGGQPLSSFVAPTIPDNVQLPIPSGSASNAVATVAPTGSKANFLLQSLAPTSTCKRPNESAPISTPTKRVAS
jgi:hypothetical protein